MNKKLLVIVPTLALLLAGCVNNGSSSENKDSSVAGSVTSNTPSETSSSEAEVVESVQINKSEATLDIGGVLDLSAVAKPATLSDKSVVWSTSDEKVATVSTGGRVTAVAAGTCKIKAAATLDQSKFAECTITVNKEQVLAYVDTPELNKAYKMGTFQANSAVNSMIYVSGAKLESQRFNTSANWADGDDFYFEAGSAQGKYKVALGSGEKKQYLNVVSTTDYHFALAAASTTEWEWDAEWATIKTFTNNKYYFPGTYNAYTTISSCDIGMAAQDYVARFYVRADKCDPTGITLNQTAAEVFAGATLQLSARVAPLGASNTEVKWTVSGNDKVTVSNTGLVTVASDATIGSTAKVKATAGNFSAECTITVKEKLNYGTLEKPLTITEARALLDKLGTKVLSAQKMFVKGIVVSNTALNSYKQTTAWLASDDGTDPKGFEIYSGLFADGITGYEAEGSLVGKEVVAEGWGMLYGTTYEFTNKNAAGEYDNAVIRSVKDGPKVDATAIALDKTTAEVEAGKTLQLKATLTPVVATTAIAWSVEGNEKVTVSDKGLVTVASDATGTATVKATAGTVSATCAITIKAAAGGDTGGDTDTAVVKIVKESITTIDSTQSSGYAKCDGTRKVGGYDVTTKDVMATTYADLPTIQMKKTTGSLKVANVKVSKVVITVLTTYDTIGADKFIAFVNGTSELAPTQDQINAALATKVATGTQATSGSNKYDCYKFTFTFEVNSSAAADFTIKTTGAAFYATDITLF